jgi:hypothetical protein
MTTNRSLRLRLEPAPEEGRIAGRLYDERGAQHDFSSWLELLTLLEHARVRANQPGPGDGRRETAADSDHNHPREER